MHDGKRSFLKAMLFALGALILWPSRIVRAEKIAVSLDKLERLKEVGGSITVKVKDRDIIFIRDAADSVKALNPVCTHKKCLVGYNQEEKRLDCPCHGSRYDLNGHVIHGPANEPLESYPAYLDDQERIIVSLGGES